MCSMMTMCDFYKISHRAMYPEGTELVYSTWTPRGSRIPGVDSVVWFGLQHFVQETLIKMFQREFFSRPRTIVLDEYKDIIRSTLGIADPDTSHISALHKLGYLPLHIRALPEGSHVPIGTPLLEVYNTLPQFFWLTNYIETLMSCSLWQATTSATIADRYRRLFEQYAKDTGAPREFVPFQGHDFSMRGMGSLESAILSGMGHLTSFVGTDTIPAITTMDLSYGRGLEHGYLIGTSVPATEHSIQCAYGDDTAYFKRLINEVHPTGIVSIVSDGYDFWEVLNTVVPSLKQDIMARDGKVVIRPDSGDPVLIVCGDPDGETDLERKGAVEVLWDIFGGTTNGKGFRTLDSHIGLIYGDAITFERAQAILSRLKAKGFASDNIVFGIGSFTYQYNTRDTFGFAMKASYCEIDGRPTPIFKDPKTDKDKIKKSLKGCVMVQNTSNGFMVSDQMPFTDATHNGDMSTVFRDGMSHNTSDIEVIRRRVRGNMP